MQPVVPASLTGGLIPGGHGQYQLASIGRRTGRAASQAGRRVPACWPKEDAAATPVAQPYLQLWQRCGRLSTQAHKDLQQGAGAAFAWECQQVMRM
jgi:hypothetical protein